MNNLNALAAKCMGWVTEVQGNGWVMWQEARDAKIKILKSGFFSSGGAKYDVFDPAHRIEHAELLLNKCKDAGYGVDIWSTENGWSIQISDNSGGGCVAAKKKLSSAITDACVAALSHDN